jgi:hypothetical protein
VGKAAFTLRYKVRNWPINDWPPFYSSSTAPAAFSAKIFPSPLERWSIVSNARPVCLLIFADGTPNAAALDTRGDSAVMSA